LNINEKLQSRIPGRKNSLDEKQMDYLKKNYHIAGLNEWALYFDVSPMTIRNALKKIELDEWAERQERIQSGR